MAETIQLDPSAIDASRTALDITSFVKADGINWGDAAISAALADQTFGSSPVDYRIPNRTIQIPLTLRTVGATTFATIRTNLQAKVALFQREGGSIMRQIDSTPYYADVVNATLHLGGSWVQAYRSADIDATLELECLPDWYGAEVTLSDHVETTAAELIFTEATVNGSYPARCRLIVDNDQATDQHGLIWGFRSRNYGTATTDRLAYEAEALETLDAATKVAHSGASGGTVVRHANLPAASWCPVLSTTIGGATYMTQRGSYRVWGRGYSGTATPALRLAWDVGDLSSPTVNPPTVLPTAGNFHLLDFGSVQLTPSPTGTHRWKGVFQAKANKQGDQVEIDRIWLQPLDEFAGRLIAVQTDSILGSYYVKNPGTVADDAAVGTLTWLTPENAEVSDWTNMALGGTGPGTTHYLKATDFGFAIPTGATISGIVLQIDRKNSYPGAENPIFDSRVSLVKAGTVQTTNKADTSTPYSGSLFGQRYGSQTDLWGTTWTPAEINNSGFGAVLSVLETGVQMPSVDVFWMIVYYTTSGGFTTTADAVMYASQSAELRTDSMVREDSTGVAYAPISQTIGDLPRLPPSGLESRTVEVLVKASRGNLADEPDAGIDDISGQIKYRPSYLFIG